MDPLHSEKHAVESRIRLVNKRPTRECLAPLYITCTWRRRKEGRKERWRGGRLISLLVIEMRTRRLNSGRRRNETEIGGGIEQRGIVSLIVEWLRSWLTFLFFTVKKMMLENRTSYNARLSAFTLLLLLFFYFYFSLSSFCVIFLFFLFFLS